MLSLNSFIMNIKRYIHNLIHHRSESLTRQKSIERQSGEIKSVVMSISRRQTVLHLQQLFFQSVEKGVTEKHLCDHEVIVSLTTFGPRIEKVYLAIESIMQGVVKPNHIVLWLSKDEFSPDSLPATLLRQQERGLQIEFCEDIRSYKKLIPALKQYPDACIITIDDDVMYEMDFLDKFVRFHRSHPGCVGVNTARKVMFDKDNCILSYVHWRHVGNEDKTSTPFLIGIGVGGILYPPHCLDSEVLNQDVFMDLCPYGDDIWFYAMALKNKSKTIKLATQNIEGDFEEIYDKVPYALCAQNLSGSENRNDRQFKAVFDHYQLWPLLNK